MAFFRNFISDENLDAQMISMLRSSLMTFFCEYVTLKIDRLLLMFFFKNNCFHLPSYCFGICIAVFYDVTFVHLVK